MPKNISCNTKHCRVLHFQSTIFYLHFLGFFFKTWDEYFCEHIYLSCIFMLHLPIETHRVKHALHYLKKNCLTDWGKLPYAYSFLNCKMYSNLMWITIENVKKISSCIKLMRFGGWILIYFFIFLSLHCIKWASFSLHSNTIYTVYTEILLFCTSHL